MLVVHILRMYWSAYRSLQVLNMNDLTNEQQELWVVN